MYWVFIGEKWPFLGAICCIHRFTYLFLFFWFLILGAVCFCNIFFFTLLEQLLLFQPVALHLLLHGIGLTGEFANEIFLKIMDLECECLWDAKQGCL